MTTSKHVARSEPWQTWSGVQKGHSVGHLIVNETQKNRSWDAPTKLGAAEGNEDAENVDAVMPDELIDWRTVVVPRRHPHISHSAKSAWF
eukprot:m.239788 g.239788  ORF g.239788 m.239788 type:complete len:90 (+) comp10921_c0_seq11:4690-4959(+)